ncbi:MAG: hypothetical protein MUF87_08305 [Anaerolineae bacterium]|jgi:hypothetical protein|nr:hypothetical protein [Anaerolineae bacterium]
MGWDFEVYLTFGFEKQVSSAQRFTQLVRQLVRQLLTTEPFQTLEQISVQDVKVAPNTEIPLYVSGESSTTIAEVLNDIDHNFQPENYRFNATWLVDVYTSIFSDDGEVEIWGSTVTLTIQGKEYLQWLKRWEKSPFDTVYDLGNYKRFHHFLDKGGPINTKRMIDELRVFVSLGVLEIRGDSAVSEALLDTPLRYHRDINGFIEDLKTEYPDLAVNYPLTVEKIVELANKVIWSNRSHQMEAIPMDEGVLVYCVTNVANSLREFYTLLKDYLKTGKIEKDQS